MFISCCVQLQSPCVRLSLCPIYSIYCVRFILYATGLHSIDNSVKNLISVAKNHIYLILLYLMNTSFKRWHTNFQTGMSINSYLTAIYSAQFLFFSLQIKKVSFVCWLNYLLHYFLRGKTITETKTKFDKYYRDSSLSIAIIHKWFTEFRCGRTSTNDTVRLGRPNEVITPKMIKEIHDIVLEDRRVKVREIIDIVKICTCLEHFT